MRWLDRAQAKIDPTAHIVDLGCAARGHLSDQLGADEVEDLRTALDRPWVLRAPLRLGAGSHACHDVSPAELPVERQSASGVAIADCAGTALFGDGDAAIHGRRGWSRMAEEIHSPRKRVRERSGDVECTLTRNGARAARRRLRMTRRPPLPRANAGSRGLQDRGRRRCSRRLGRPLARSHRP